MNNFEPLQERAKPAKQTPHSGRKLRYRRWLIQWHHRLGIIAAFFVLILVVTGLLLNHTHQLKLGNAPVANSLLLSLYGIKQPEVVGLKIDDQWLNSVDGSHLYLNDNAYLHCNGNLVGAVKVPPYQVIACEQELLMVSATFELIERIEEIYQLPVPVTHIGTCGDTPCLQSLQAVYRIDLDALDWQKLEQQANSQWSGLSAPPKQLTTSIIDGYQGQEITWERIVLDLHSGRIAGGIGVLIMDLAALFLGYLALSGAWLYWRRRG